MKTINDSITGNLIISVDTSIQGTIKGSVSVGSDCNLILNGTIAKDLIIEENSKAELNGVVSGNVINNGGSLRVYGVIFGDLYKNAGEVYIDSKAVIKGNTF